MAPPDAALQRLLPAADSAANSAAEPPTAFSALAAWHRRTGGRLLVAVTGAESWLASGPAQAVHDPHAAAWLALLRHPGLPVHVLLALDERCEPWLARWQAHWPDLGDQTLRLAAPPPPCRTDAPRASEPAVDPALEAAMAAAVCQAIATAARPAPPPAADRPLTRRAATLAAAVVLVAGGLGIWRAQPPTQAPAPVSPLPMAVAPRTAPAEALAQVLPRVAAAAGLELVADLAGLGPHQLAWVGHERLVRAWRDRAPAVQVLTPLFGQEIRFLVRDDSPLRTLQQAAGLPLVATDARAQAAGTTAWHLALGQVPVFQAAGPVHVSLGEPPPPGWRALPPDPAHPGTARARRQLLPGADGGLALMAYLVVGAGTQAPSAAALQQLGDAWCQALPTLPPADAAAWRGWRQGAPWPTPVPTHPAAARWFAGCTPPPTTVLAGARP